MTVAAASLLCGPPTPRGSSPPPDLGKPLAHHEVYQAPRHVDALLEVPPLDVGPETGAREGELPRVLLADIRRRLYAVAQLAVDLDDERDLICGYEALVPGGPPSQVDRVLLLHLRPHLLGVVRRERREDGDEGPQGVLPPLLPHFAPDRQQVVGVLHQRGDGRVEPERLEVLRDLLDRPVRPPVELSWIRLRPRRVAPAHEREGAPQKPRDALDAAPVPGTALVPGAYEHAEAARRLGAVAVHEVLRVDDVAAALAHLLRVLAEDDPLVEEPGERLAEVYEAQVAHDLRPEAGVEQVHDRVLDAAGVLVHGEPPLSCLRIEGSLVVMRREVSVPVPRGVHERVHRVGLPLGGTATPGALRVPEALVPLERRLARGHELGVLGEQYRQVLLGDGDGAARAAVD